MFRRWLIAAAVGAVLLTDAHLVLPDNDPQQGSTLVAAPEIPATPG